MKHAKETETMTMQMANGKDELDHFDDDTRVSHVDMSAVAVLNRSEVECQLDAAHKYTRQIGRFLREAHGLATINRKVAESCIYSLPRGGKVIAGPSVRLAEICASAYGNLHVAARVLDAEEKEIVAQGVAWDLEKNLRVTVEVRRRITNRAGKRFDDDMITVTGNAAASIALRNAIFRVIPRAYVDTIYGKVREVAVGDAKTLAARRAEMVERLQKIGVPRERIFVRVGKTMIDDIDLNDLEVLVGLGSAIADGNMAIDDAFPEPDTTAAKSKALEGELLGTGAPTQQAPRRGMKDPKKVTAVPKDAAPPQQAAPPPAPPSQPKSASIPGVTFDPSWHAAKTQPAPGEDEDDYQGATDNPNDGP